MKEIKNPILYISGPGYSYDYFEPKLSQINDHFNSIIKGMNFKNREGKTISINLTLEATNHDDIAANAIRIDKTNARYEVKMTAGLSYHLWLASRFITADYEYFSWTNKCSIIHKELQNTNIKELLADFTYYLASYYILLHEISHIFLGHCDYIQDKLHINSLNEFETNSTPMSNKDQKIRIALEAEADRQAGEFLSAIFDHSLGESGLGTYYTFPSREAAYEFYVYSITSVFTLLQQLTLRQDRIHPLPNERQQIVVMAMEKYLKKYNIKDGEKLKALSSIYMMKAGEKLGLIDASEFSTVINTSFGLAWIDDIIKEIGIRSFQHKMNS